MPAGGIAKSSLLTRVGRDAEKYLAQMEGRYQGLLETAPDAMIVVNQSGEIILLNVQAERLFGYRRQELVGQPVQDVIPEGFADPLLADAFRSVDKGTGQENGAATELVARRRDGSELPIEVTLGPLKSLEGILVTAAIRDISKRKETEAQLKLWVRELKHSNEELAQFAYIASHDLQEPLRMVTSFTQLLAERYKGVLGPDGDQFIAFAVDGAVRMQRSIEDLLTYAHAAATDNGLCDISSAEALQEALFHLRGELAESGALVTFDPLPTVHAHPKELTQVFQNLVGNAIKYQNRDGRPRVHISATNTDGKKWSFAVADNGIGIEPQYFERIFGMFQRLHKREEYSGTGVGLAICKKIVERRGGDMSVESKPGQGSTFRFTVAGSPKSK